MKTGPAFEELDFVYMPTGDAASDVAYFTNVLGAQLVFAIEGMGTRVAMLELSPSPPAILLAEHLEGDTPVLVYRVPDLAEAISALESRGFMSGAQLEIPQGPICSFVAPGGQRLAIYQLTRPDVIEHFAGRRDF